MRAFIIVVPKYYSRCEPSPYRCIDVINLLRHANLPGMHQTLNSNISSSIGQLHGKSPCAMQGSFWRRKHGWFKGPGHCRAVPGNRAWQVQPGACRTHDRTPFPKPCPSPQPRRYLQPAAVSGETRSPAARPAVNTAARSDENNPSASHSFALGHYNAVCCLYHANAFIIRMASDWQLRSNVK